MGSILSSIKENLKINELIFGAHLHVELTLTPQLGEKFYRSITKIRKDLFTRKFIQAGFPFVFIHEKFKSRCIISDKSLIYTERRDFDHVRFREISRTLSKEFLKAFEFNEDNFRILGKIYGYTLEVPGVFNKFKESVSFFKEDAIGRLFLRTLFKEKGNNIHLELSSVDVDNNLVEDLLIINCDINNADQDSNHKLDALDGILTFSDNYNTKRLPKLLSRKLGLKN